MYLNAVSRIHQIYNLPSSIINLLTLNLKTLSQTNYQKDSAIRLIDKCLKKNKIYLKIQIVNSRAKYYIALSEIIDDYEFIQSCEPRSLIEIGYFSRVEEFKKLLLLKEDKPLMIKNKSSLCFKKKSKNNEIVAENYLYNFLEVKTHDSVRNVKLLIGLSSKFFDVPSEDLMIDLNLMENIYPPDLLRIGYHLCDLDLQEQKKPLFII